MDNKRIAKNTFILYTRLILTMVASFYASRVILEVLGASDFGIYNVVGGVVVIMNFLNGALSASTSRFLTYELGVGNIDKLKQTFSASLNLHIGVALLVFLLGETVGLWFFYEKLVIPEDRMQAAFWVYQFSIVTTMLNFTQTPYNATLIAHENMSIYAYVALYQSFSKLIIVYILALLPFDKLIIFSLLLMLNSFGIQFFFRFYTSRKYEECSFRIVRNSSLYRTLLGYSSWDLFGNLGLISQGQGVNILLNIFFGPLVNAARAIVLQIQCAINGFSGNLLVAFRPQVVKSFAQGNYEEMYSLTFSATKYAYLLVLAFTVPLYFESDYLLKLWLGDNTPVDTFIFARIAILTDLLETFQSAALMPFHAIGRIKMGSIVGGTLMILALPISYVCLKCGMPAYTVFIVILIVNVIRTFWLWFLLYRYVAFRWRALMNCTIFPIIIITIITVPVAMLITSYFVSSFLRMVLTLLSVEVVLLVSTYYLGLSKGERVKLISFISRFKASR